mgnify:FL=1
MHHKLEPRSLRSSAERYHQEYLATLETFVNLDSGTHDRDAVQRAAEFVSGIFRASGGQVEWERSPVAEIADSYIVRWAG